MKSHTMTENYFNNPIKLLHHLKDAGFTEKQAEAQVQMMSDYIEHGLATKQDLKIVKQDLVVAMRELELRLTIKTAGIVGSIVGFFSILEKIVK